MRQTFAILTLMTGLLLAHAARADDAAEFEAVAELPAAQVLCVGEAALPDMLRFAFQPEPDVSGPAEIIRVSTARRAAPRPAASRQTARQAAASRPAPSGPPTLRLPCIRG